jgi:translation initiation factor 4E
MPQTPIPQTPGAALGWMEDIKRVIQIDSVEEFWGYVVELIDDDLLGMFCLTICYCRMYNNIVPPSQLPQKANYYLFKASIKSCSEPSLLCLLMG